MNKFNEIYNKIISEWNLLNKDKTKLKYRWDEADELLSKEELIEKYVDYSDTDWKWDYNGSNDDNIIFLYEKLINDRPNSDRVNFILSLLSDEGHMELQEKYNSKREDELIDKHLKAFY
jgi:hypothetical protein